MSTCFLPQVILEINITAALIIEFQILAQKAIMPSQHLPSKTQDAQFSNKINLQ